MVPLVALLVTVVAMMSWSATGRDWWWAVALGGLGLGLAGASTLAQNRFNSLDMAESLLVASLFTLGGAVALAVDTTPLAGIRIGR